MGAFIGKYVFKKSAEPAYVIVDEDDGHCPFKASYLARIGPDPEKRRRLAKAPPPEAI